MTITEHRCVMGLMGQATLQIVEVYNVHCCATCGVSYALTEAYENRRREDHARFHCPNGHGHSYPHQTDAEKAREEAKNQRQRAERLASQVVSVGKSLERERRRHSATKGQLTKTRKRVSHGVCPCCNRTFAQVSAHMKRMHPDYIEDHG